MEYTNTSKVNISLITSDHNIKITNNDIADIHRSQGLTDDDFDVEGDSFDEEGSVNSDY
ncbi:hypothetical protein DFJ63DRAFT_335842 [Scheffersomyces coipomensis]|uniref:uncharacterized protein n=1 Tax=Scheffersomyces coipomensis TaxID=1788519 RepID=UPI00315C4F16